MSKKFDLDYFKKITDDDLISSLENFKLISNDKITNVQILEYSLLYDELLTRRKTKKEIKINAAKISNDIIVKCLNGIFYNSTTDISKAFYNLEDLDLNIYLNNKNKNALSCDVYFLAKMSKNTYIGNITSIVSRSTTANFKNYLLDNLNVKVLDFLRDKYNDIYKWIITE